MMKTDIDTNQLRRSRPAPNRNLLRPRAGGTLRGAQS